MKDRDANGAVSKKHGLLTAVIIIAAAVLLQKLFILGMSRDCFRNAAEEVNALNAEETLIKYFEYWDEGNLYGQALIRDEEPPREYKNLSSQAYAHVFSANFAADCVKNPCRATARLRIFALSATKLCSKIRAHFL